MRPRGHRGADRGSAPIEVLGFIPIIVLTAGLVLQLFLIAVAATRAESAARLASREASKGAPAGQVEAAVASTVGGAFDPAVTVARGQLSTGSEPGLAPVADGDAVSATVTVTVPFIGIGVDGLNMRLTRHAVMPMTD